MPHTNARLFVHEHEALSEAGKSLDAQLDAAITPILEGAAAAGYSRRDIAQVALDTAGTVAGFIVLGAGPRDPQACAVEPENVSTRPRLFTKHEAYTADAIKLDIQASTAMRTIFEEWASRGFSLRDIEAVMRASLEGVALDVRTPGRCP